MAIVSNLTPTAINSLDYDTAQGPTLGAERELYLTAQPQLLLGIATLSTTGVVSYEYINSQISKTLTGTVSKDGTDTVTGSGTAFLTEVRAGDRILIPGTADELLWVESVESNTSLTLVDAAVNTASAQTATSYPDYPVLAFVMNELKADAASVITIGDLSGTMSPVSYSANTSFNFPAGRGVELVGAGTTLITSAVVPTVTNAKRGSKIGFVQVPKLEDFVLIRNTRSKDVTIPVKQSKAIASGLNSSRYTKPGVTVAGNLKVSALDQNWDDGIARFFGTKCVAMLATVKEERILTDRSFLVNYTPGASSANPDADNESTVDCDGAFQYMAVLPTPGGG
jgi:hypothetical protein